MIPNSYPLHISDRNIVSVDGACDSVLMVGDYAVVSQPATAGKYVCVKNCPPLDISSSSVDALHACSSTARVGDLVGSTADPMPASDAFPVDTAIPLLQESGLWEAPHIFDRSIVTVDGARGSVLMVGDCAGVSQPATAGKYVYITNSPPRDFSPHSSPNVDLLHLRSPTACVGNIADSTTEPMPAENVPGADTQSTLEQLHVYYQNVRGLRTKIVDFLITVSSTEYDVIVLTETWLDDRILSLQLFGNSFMVYRADRNPLTSVKTRGGGVLVAVNKRLISRNDPVDFCANLQKVWVAIKTASLCISIGVIYLAPDLRNDVMRIQSHVDSTGIVLNRREENDLVIVFGDYNQPSLFWKQVDNYTSRSTLFGLYHRLQAVVCLTECIFTVSIRLI